MSTAEEYEIWCATRPPHVAEVARRFQPWLEYQFKETKRLCTIYSFGECEDGSITLKVLQPDLFFPGVCDNLVFGVRPDDIEIADEHCVRPIVTDVEVVEGADGVTTYKGRIA